MEYAVDESQGGPARGSPASVLTRDRLLGRRLVLYIKVRFLVVPVLVGGAFVARDVMGVEDLDVASLTVLAIVIALYNAVILGLALPRLDPADAGEHRPVLRGLFRVSMGLDFLALTFAVWLLGGARSPFLAFYLFHIVITSLLLSRKSGVFAALFATALLAALVLGEYGGLITPHSPTGVTPHEGPLDGRYVLTVLIVYPTFFLLISLLVTSLMHLLRRAELGNQEKTLELERLSALRRAFLRVVLHDLNGPVSVVTMLLRNMREGRCGPLEPQQVEQLERALRRLDDIEAFIKDLRLLSELETADLSEHTTELSLTLLLGEVVEESSDLAADRAQALEMEPTDARGSVAGVPRLLREAMANYIGNALKYTPDGGTIRCRVIERDGRVRVEVSDDGEGIEPDDQHRLFTEFTRVVPAKPRPDQPKGSGLGLSIVRRIIEMHDGRVGVHSEPGRGSTFWFELPAAE